MMADQAPAYDRAPAYEVSEARYARLLGYPPGKLLEGGAAEVAEASREWMARYARPWAHWRVLSITAVEPDVVVVEGAAVLRSGPLARGVGEYRCTHLAVMAASAGPEVDEQAERLWSSDRPDEGYFLQRLANAVVEWLVADALCCLEQETGHRAAVTQSPGYPGWDLAEQPTLVRLLRGKTGLLGPLQVLESGALLPQMSKLSVYGLNHGLDGETAQSQNPCAPCRQPSCQYRRRNPPRSDR